MVVHMVVVVRVVEEDQDILVVNLQAGKEV